MINVSTNRNFRLSPWPYAPGAERTFFNNRTKDNDFSALLLYLFDSLYKAHRPLIFPDSFTLVNTTYRNVRSVGQFPAPPANVRSGTLSFTFSLTPFKSYSLGAAANSYRNGSLVFWGQNVIRSNDFLTVNVPESIYRKAGLYNNILAVIKHVHAIVGSATKNYVLFNKRPYYDRELSESEMAMRNASIGHISMAQCLVRYPYRDWAFNHSMWREGASALSFSTMTASMKSNYIRRIYDGTVHPRFEIELRGFLAEGVRDLLQYVKYPTQLTDSAIAVAFLLLGPDSTVSTQIKAAVDKLMLGIAEHGDEYFERELGDINHTVQALLDPTLRRGLRTILGDYYGRHQ